MKREDREIKDFKLIVHSCTGKIRMKKRNIK